MTTESQIDLSAKHCVFAHIKMPDAPALTALSPIGNWIAPMILSGFLERGFHAAGIKVESLAIIGEFNDCVFIAIVDDIKAGLESLRNDLRKFGLLDVVKLGYFDAKEIIWRTVHPQVTDSFNPQVWGDQLRAKSDAFIFSLKADVFGVVL